MAKPKMHYRSPYVAQPTAICGYVTTPSFTTADPDKVTCAYCRKRNLKAITKQYPAKG